MYSPGVSGERPLNSTSSQLQAETGKLLDNAVSAGVALATVTAADLFELVTTLSWGVDRYGDDELAARRRVAIATAGIFQVA